MEMGVPSCKEGNVQIQEAFDLIKTELEQVDLEFKKNLDSQVYLVRKVGEYILSSGG